MVMASTWKGCRDQDFQATMHPCDSNVAKRERPEGPEPQPQPEANVSGGRVRWDFAGETRHSPPSGDTGDTGGQRTDKRCRSNLRAKAATLRQPQTQITGAHMCMVLGSTAALGGSRLGHQGCVDRALQSHSEGLRDGAAQVASSLRTPVF